MDNTYGALLYGIYAANQGKDGFPGRTEYLAELSLRDLVALVDYSCHLSLSDDPPWFEIFTLLDKLKDLHGID